MRWVDCVPGTEASTTAEEFAASLFKKVHSKQGSTAFNVERMKRNLWLIVYKYSKKKPDYSFYLRQVKRSKRS